ncbi:hypothetical protein B0T22DRAFT_464078 [Podospora appendiculata]|uniref:Uncharacterized protein n=1 Tax=Podospora appendiculata TaxID=314037 RepID=A0AAE1C9Q6_9PEZI|nr:hypothetical protein B0T22DRAFT_464078 [Podospora appendiculata]
MHLLPLPLFRLVLLISEIIPPHNRLVLVLRLVVALPAIAADVPVTPMAMVMPIQLRADTAHKRALVFRVRRLGGDVPPLPIFPIPGSTIKPPSLFSTPTIKAPSLVTTSIILPTTLPTTPTSNWQRSSMLLP